MSASIEVLSPRILYTSDGEVTVKSDCVVDGKTYPLHFKASSGPVSHSVEPFLCACLPSAMKLRAELHAQGCVSSRLLNALPKIQNIYSGWFPELQTVRVQVTPAAEAPYPEETHPVKRGVACFFSGGVDSFYSTLKHLDEIDTLVLIHGFDIGLHKNDTELLHRISTELREAATFLGKRLIEVEMNHRPMTNQYAHWGYHQHGASLAAIAHLLAPQIRKIYIPSSYAFDHLFPWSSHPDVDPLWSTEEIELVHDGNEATRVQKVDAIAKSDVALQHLHVCWVNKNNAYNCGRCEKCLRTLINLRVVGAQDKYHLFARPLSLWEVSRLFISDKGTRIFLQENLDELRRRPSDPALERALQNALSERYYRGPWKIARQAWWKVKNLYWKIRLR